ncbi:hypothetical protein ACSNOB_06995 [Micromonospora sp. URMC 106]|uniref:hypothetical protein n=1 Tax=Micromonospora sp. URMC 106 TaxID=3423408 RepID=UPI003F1E04FB
MDTNGVTADADDVAGAHRGIDWPAHGGNPFDSALPWPGLLYWAHEQPSRVFPADRVPSADELHRAIPMGYSTLSLMARIALYHGGQQRRLWPEENRRTPRGPLQPYQLLLPATDTRRPLRFGANWPVRFALRDAEELSARTGGAVLLCQVLEFHNWH